MTRARLWAAVTVGAALVCPRAARAEETSELDELLSESIVSTPSKSSETATTAPATSSIVTAEELRSYGIRSLDEAINFLSVGMVTSAPLHALEIGARGVMLTSDYGNHVLVLLDQHPLNEPWNGSAYFDRGLGVPLEQIDHIEVILGPGSVLYGSQAMLGVIHVVTKRAADRSGVSLVMESDVALPTQRSGDLIAPSLSGSYLERVGTGFRLGAGLGYTFRAGADDGEIRAALEYYRQDGPSLELGPQAYGADSVTGEPKNFGPNAPPGIWGGVTSRHAYSTEVPTAYVRVLWGDWSVAARGALYRRVTPYLDGTVNVTGDFDDESSRELDRWVNTELAFRPTLTEVMDLSLRAYADLYDYRWQNGSSAAEDCFGGVLSGCTQYLLGRGNTLGTDAQLRLSWLPELRFDTLLGVDSRMRFIRSDYDVVDGMGEQLPIENDHRRADAAIAVYAQHSLSPTDWMDLNVGARFDYDERSGSALSPRSALGISPWEGGRLKLIYSEAFRAPSAYELGYADYTTQISPENLNAETVRSVEASIEHRFGAHRILFGVFRSWWADMVAYAVLEEGELAAAQAAGLLDPSISEAYVYTNVARIDNYGYNASFEGSSLRHHLRYGLNVTSAFSREDPMDGSEPRMLTVGPSLFGNARISYEFRAPLPTVALAAQFQRRRLADTALDGGFARTPSAPPHLELKLTLTGQVPGVPGLRYRAGGNYAFSRVSPYVIGPWQFAVDETTPYELAPLRRAQVFVGVEYQFGR